MPVNPKGNGLHVLDLEHICGVGTLGNWSDVRGVIQIMN